MWKFSGHVYRVLLGVIWDNAKENGSYYFGFRVSQN